MNVRGFQQLHDGPVVEFYPGRLWSLLDMLPSHAQKYINLGRDIENARLTFGFVEAGLQNSLKDDDIIRLHGHMGHMRDLCRELGLTTSSALLAKRLGDVPKTSREFELLVDTIELELNDRLFLYIPPHRAKYFDVVMPSIVTVAFPRASRELVAAGNSFAAALYDASVFHSMRAAEIGVRALGTEMQILLPKPIEFCDWQDILNGLNGKIKELENKPRTTPDKDKDLQFFSESSAQFRFFKNAWRAPNAHGRNENTESDALKVFDHTLSFFQTLASRLKESVETFF